MCRRRWMYALNHNLIKLILSAQKAYLTWLFTLLTSRNFYMRNHKSYMTKITVKTVFVLSGGGGKTAHGKGFSLSLKTFRRCA